MCGRYFIEIDEKELQEIANKIEKDARICPGQLTIKTSGDIFPADIVPVQTGPGRYQAMKWGFTGFDGKPVINARSETAREKPMFKQSMYKRRCLIPASGYYEWQRDGDKKIKYQFFISDSPMYFAGCWRQDNNSPLCTFVILTKAASGGLEAIHTRMPVIIPKDFFEVWLNDSPEIMGNTVTDVQYVRCGSSYTRDR